MPREFRPYTHAEIKVIKRLAFTHNDRAIAKYLPGRSPGAIQLKRWRMGLRDYVTGSHGHDDEVRQMATAGYYDKEIADKVGLDWKVVYRIRRRLGLRAGRFAHRPDKLPPRSG